jgi:hypothetical protein
MGARFAMMEPPDPPLDRKTAAALVSRTVDTIDASSKEERDALLLEFLRAAWGTIWAQNQ